VKSTVLTDKDILLRPFVSGDADALYRAVRESVNEVSPWMPWCSMDYSFDESKNWIEHTSKAWSNDSEFDFAIVDTKDGALIGGCGLNSIDKLHKVANLGYWVRSSRTGKGVAPVVTRLLARFAFEKLGLNRVEIIPALGNRKSQRVAEKSGATREGVMRRRIVVRDNVYDGVMFSLVPEDLDDSD
jgi:RimJ/RimL family protein N-acetyltransferase